MEQQSKTYMRFFKNLSIEQLLIEIVFFSIVGIGGYSAGVKSESDKDIRYIKQVESANDNWRFAYTIANNRYVSTYAKYLYACNKYREVNQTNINLLNILGVQVRQQPNFLLPLELLPPTKVSQTVPLHK